MDHTGHNHGNAREWEDGDWQSRTGMSRSYVQSLMLTLELVADDEWLLAAMEAVIAESTTNVAGVITLAQVHGALKETATRNEMMEAAKRHSQDRLDEREDTERFLESESGKTFTRLSTPVLAEMLTSFKNADPRLVATIGALITAEMAVRRGETGLDLIAALVQEAIDNVQQAIDPKDAT